MAKAHGTTAWCVAFAVGAFAGSRLCGWGLCEVQGQTGWTGPLNLVGKGRGAAHQPTWPVAGGWACGRVVWAALCFLLHLHHPPLHPSLLTTCTGSFVCVSHQLVRCLENPTRRPRRRRVLTRLQPEPVSGSRRHQNTRFSASASAHPVLLSPPPLAPPPTLSCPLPPRSSTTTPHIERVRALNRCVLF